MDDAARESAKRVILLTVFLDLLGFGIVLPQLGVYASQFGASPWLVGILASSYSAMSFLSTPFWGRLSDRIGRRPVMLYSIFGTAIGYIFFALAGSLPLLFVSRLVDGVTAGNISTAQAYLSDITEPENRTKTFGLFGAMFGVGFALGPAVGAAISGLPGMWGGNFGVGIFTALLALINWALALKRLPETLSPQVRAANVDKDRAGGSRRQLFNFSGFKRAFQIPGLSLMITISFFATLAFATLQGTYTLFLIKQYVRPQVQTYIRAAPKRAIAEAQQEKHNSSPTATHLASSAGGEGAAPAATAGENEPYPPSLGGDFTLPNVAAPDGMTWRQIEKILVQPRAVGLAAWIFATIGFIGLLVQGVFINGLKNRFGEVPLVVAGTLLMAVGLALVPLPKSVLGEFPVMALLAFGNFIASPILTALASELAPENERGEMLGVFQSIGSLGRIFGPNVGGTLFNVFGYGAPYFAGGFIMLFAFGFALRLKKTCASILPGACGPKRAAAKTS